MRKPGGPGGAGGKHERTAGPRSLRGRPGSPPCWCSCLTALGLHDLLPPKSGPIRPLSAHLLSSLEADLPVPNPGSTEGGRLRGPCPCCAFPWPGVDQWLRQVSALTRPGPWEPPAGLRQAPSRGSGGAGSQQWCLAPALCLPEADGRPGMALVALLRSGRRGPSQEPLDHLVAVRWGEGPLWLLGVPVCVSKGPSPGGWPHKDPAGESLAPHGEGSLPHARILTEALGDSGWGSWFLPPRTC